MITTMLIGVTTYWLLTPDNEQHPPWLNTSRLRGYLPMTEFYSLKEPNLDRLGYDKGEKYVERDVATSY